MRVAIATENGSVSGHFGYCEGFTIYDVRDGAAFDKRYVENPGHERGLLPRLLKGEGVETVIAGGMGERAQGFFSEYGIKVITGAEGSCDTVINDFCAGTLKSGDAVCHEHMHSHECGEH